MLKRSAVADAFWFIIFLLVFGYYLSMAINDFGSDGLQLITARAEGEEIPGFQIPEGLARITRNGHMDIYLIQNRSPLGAYRLSIAFSMDDFEEGKDAGYNFIVRETDEVEHLGAVKEYFSPLKPTEKWIALVAQQINRSAGFLPIVRAWEKLRGLGNTPTDGEIRLTVQEVVADYHTRRLMLNVGVRAKATSVAATDDLPNHAPPAS